MEFIIRKLFQKFNFFGRLASLQFWNCIRVHNGWYLTVKDQPSISTRYHKELVNYRNNCLNLGHCFVGLQTEIDNPYLFAGIAAQTGVADQRTYRDRDQFTGQLVLPVYGYIGANKVLVGVIELITLGPLEEGYAAAYNQIHELLKEEDLATKPKVKKIKVDYGDNTIIIYLPFSSGITCLWKEVTMRFKKLNRKDNQINYKDCSGRVLPILNDADLWACMSKSSLMTIKMFIASKAIY